MRDVEGHDEAIRRILSRDDLLTLAAAADRAVGIVRQRETEVARRGADGQTLFDLALERQVKLAEKDRRWAIRTQAWDHAAVLVRYCALVDIPLNCPYTASAMHASALAEVEENAGPRRVRRLDKDLTLGAFNRYHAARDLRLEGRIQDALDLARRSPEDLYGTGAEPHIAHYHYEMGAAYIIQGGARQIRGHFNELERYWETTRAKDFSTHHRFEFIRALVSWSAKPRDERIRRHFDASIGMLGINFKREDVSAHDGADSHGVRELSVLLAAAEYLATTGDDADRATAMDLALRALAVADQVRARWRVIARSRAPLAEVFHRVYGDIALLAHRIGDEPAAGLGLRAALSAKSTGFAVRIRDGLTFDDNPHINNLLEQIVEIENPSAGPLTDTPQSRQQALVVLREELADSVSPMLADTVFPPPTDLTDLIKEIGPRYVLDYVELKDTLKTTAFFRTLIEPGGRMSFDRFDPGQGFHLLIEHGSRIGDLVRGLDRGISALEDTPESPNPDETAKRDVVIPPVPGLLTDGRLDFRALASSILPARLTEEILPATVGSMPVRLLVSAHSWLSLLPWAALRIDDAGTRLVQRAVISQCPVLTCLSGELPPPVTGNALIRLVGLDEKVQVYETAHHGVNVALEREAWELGHETVGVPLSTCDLRGGGTPELYRGRFDVALAHRDQWQFLHIATHGGGKGFDQLLGIPGEPLSAARALGLRWPTSVLMASCHVGLVLNDNGAEPLSFVMAMLTGGARCVVAGIDSIDDAGTGRVAGAIVRAVRREQLPLDVALRNAQLAEIEANTPESGWALLSAYIR